jgi:hypothetical protein
MAKKSQPEQSNGPPTLDSLLEMAIELGKSANTISKALTEHVNGMSCIDHGNYRAPNVVEPMDHTMRSKITVLITALHDFRLAMRHALLIGVHDEGEKTKIIRGDYC